MIDTESLLKEIEELRSALYVIDEDLTLGAPEPEAIRELAAAVNTIRRTVWGILKSRHPDAQQSFLARLRVARAIQICEDVLPDLSAETVHSHTPGFSIYHSTLTELSQAFREAPHA